ncbi:carbohydrate ABC transporter permease [Solirhodobacter olei]|uniref:carbohydrate ABC transporter permease n=1 Tax=Solirhodobacter olei TaxID=2493082 RepID=UPI000FDA13A5|nr:carbohydrate ABC transporter permease [Solirhodobacter olei]
MVVTRKARIVSATITYGVLIAFAIFCLFPFLWMLDTALKPQVEVMSVTPTFVIKAPTLANFRHVLFDSQFAVYFRNSIIVATASTILTVILGIFASYALSRWTYLPITKVVGTALVLSQMIPGVLLLVPLYVLMRNLGLLSTYSALIIVYCTFMVPLVTFLLKGFFDGVPRELEEAATVDGCSRLKFIFRILVPLSAPGILATAVFAFIAAWNEFMFGYVLINNDARRTLTPGIMIFKGTHQTDWASLSAASVLAVLPVAIGFVYLQRYLVEGLANGAVKG